LNSIHIKGRLTRDPDFKTLDSGKSVVTFSVAVNRRYQKDTADFFTVTAWEKTAELINTHFIKGQEILIEGEMQSRKYTDKDGNKRTAWEIRLENFDFCGGKKDNSIDISADDIPPNAPAASASTGSNNDFVEIAGDDDLPF